MFFFVIRKQTALHKAAAYRRHNICQLLLEAGACPTARDAHGRRPRRLAYDAGDSALAHHLQRKYDETFRSRLCIWPPRENGILTSLNHVHTPSTWLT